LMNAAQLKDWDAESQLHIEVMDENAFSDHLMGSALIRLSQLQDGEHSVELQDANGSSAGMGSFGYTVKLQDEPAWITSQAKLAANISVSKGSVAGGKGVSLAVPNVSVKGGSVKGGKGASLDIQVVEPSVDLAVPIVKGGKGMSVNVDVSGQASAPSVKGGKGSMSVQVATTKGKGGASGPDKATLEKQKIRLKMSGLRCSALNTSGSSTSAHHYLRMKLMGEDGQVLAIDESVVADRDLGLSDPSWDEELGFSVNAAQLKQWQHAGKIQVEVMDRMDLAREPKPVAVAIMDLPDLNSAASSGKEQTAELKDSTGGAGMGTFGCKVELEDESQWRKEDSTEWEQLSRQMMHLTVSKVHCASLLKLDSVNESDPYLVMTMTDSDGNVLATQESSVKKNESNPVWDEAFDFSVNAAQLKNWDHQGSIGINVMDRKRSTDDQSCGSTTLRLSDLNSKDMTKGEHTVALRDSSGAVAGGSTLGYTVLVEDDTTWKARDAAEFERLTSEKMHLKMSGLSCACLKNVDTMSKSDPYLVMTVVDRDGKVLETKQTLVEEEDLNPNWGDASFDFSLTAAQLKRWGHEATLHINVMNKNAFADNLMGSTTIRLSELTPGQNTLALQDATGASQGLGSLSYCVLLEDEAAWKASNAQSSVTVVRTTKLKPPGGKIKFEPRVYPDVIREIYQTYELKSRGYVDVHGPSFKSAIEEVGKYFGLQLDLQAIVLDAQSELDEQPDFNGFMECLDIIECLLDVYTIH